MGERLGAVLTIIYLVFNETYPATRGDRLIRTDLAAEHCKAARAADTNWREILRLYDILGRVEPSTVVSLNRAVAVAMVECPRRGLDIIDGLAARGDRQDSPPARPPTEFRVLDDADY